MSNIIADQQAQFQLAIDSIFGAVNHTGWDTQRYPTVGLFINLIIHGITMAMYLAYLTRPSKHTFSERLSLAGCILLTNISTYFVILRVYDTVVLKWASPDRLVRIHWSSHAATLLAAPIYMMSNIVYARRLFSLVKNKLWIKIPAYISIAIVFGMSLGSVIIFFRMPVITAGFFDPALGPQVTAMNTYFSRFLPWFISASTFLPTFEGALCVAMIWKIQQERRNTHLQSTAQLLTHIATVSIRSLALPTIAHFATLALFTYRSDAKKSQCLSNYIEKLVLISLLALFADRDALREKSKESSKHGISVHLDTFQVSYSVEDTAGPGLNRMPYGQGSVGRGSGKGKEVADGEYLDVGGRTGEEAAAGREGKAVEVRL